MAFTPTIVDAWLTLPYAGYAGQVRYHDRDWSGVQAFIVHVQDGNSSGTQMHFRTVKASSTVLIDKDGTIRRLVPENKAPWTNGDVKNPDAQVRALMNKYGPDPNTWSLTIECEGYSGGLPYTEAQYQAILWQLRQWRKQYGDKPVLAHRQVNSVDRAACPEAPGGPLLPRLYKDLAGGESAPRFKKGDGVRFTDNLNIRHAWTMADTYKGKPNVIATLPAGTVATIIDGPNYADGYEWWDVSIDGFGTGHVAGDWLEATAAPKPKPVPVSKTFTTRFELPLRTESGFSGTITKTLPIGTTGEIIEGPQEKDGIPWYRIQTSAGDKGWFPGSIVHTLAIKG